MSRIAVCNRQLRIAAVGGGAGGGRICGSNCAMIGVGRNSGGNSSMVAVRLNPRKVQRYVLGLGGAEPAVTIFNVSLLGKLEAGLFGYYLNENEETLKGKNEF